MDDTFIIQKLKEFKLEGATLQNKLASYDFNSSSNRVYDGESETWRGKCLNFLRLRFSENSNNFQDFKASMDKQLSNRCKYCKENVNVALGVLNWTIDALESGATEDLFYQREIILFDDLLRQAYEFYDKGLDLAAAIYGRIVLETIIKEFANKNLASAENFEQRIINLRKKGKITIPIEHSLRANYKIGSDATHNSEEFAKISKGEIKNMLDFVRDRVLTLD